MAAEGAGEPAPELSEEDKGAIIVQSAVRCKRARQVFAALLAEHKENLRRVPNTGWSYDRLRNVLVCSCNTAKAPHMISPDILFSIDSEVAECVVSIYEGERDEATGLYAGHGKATFVTGQVYEGQWENGLMHGTGVFTWKNGVVYKGPVVKGHLSGKGILKWPGGNVYDGEIVDGYRQGKGKFVMVKESDEVEDEDAVISYDGAWFRGRRHGYGILQYDSDGKQKYEGEWYNDKRHGAGTMLYKSGNVYKGMWHTGAPHGEGQMLWHSRNEVYIGEWQRGKQNGKGVQAWFMEVQPGTSFQRLNKYDGDWVDGKRHGHGVFEYADGARYEGQWADNLKHGMGKYTFPDGSVYKGEFSHDSMVNYSQSRVPLQATAEILISVNDLLTNQEEPEGEVRKIKSILVQYMSELKQIFRYYSQPPLQEELTRVKSDLNISRVTSASNTLKSRTASPALGASSLIKLLPWQQRTTVDNAFAISMIDFWKFAKDCRIPDSQLSLAEIDRIFLLVDKHSNEKHDLESVHNPKRKIIYRGFLEGVVRLADRKYQNLLTTSERLSHALFHNILPYACQENHDNFRAKMGDPQCMALVAAYEVHLQDLFQSLCPEGEKTTQLRHIIAFMQERRLVQNSVELNGKMVELYFKSLSGEASLLDTNRTNIDSEIIFSEFSELILRFAEQSAQDSKQAFLEVLQNFFSQLLPDVSVDWMSTTRTSSGSTKKQHASA